MTDRTQGSSRCPAPAEANGVHFLLNRPAEIRPGVWLVGFDDTAFARSGTERALAGVPDGVYRIALFHAPLFFSGSAGRYELALAGHSHGGQVRLPSGGRCGFRTASVLTSRAGFSQRAPACM